MGVQNFELNFEVFQNFRVQNLTKLYLGVQNFI